MTTNSTNDIKNLINSIQSNNTIDSMKQFESIWNSKIADGIESRKKEIGNSLFSISNIEEGTHYHSVWTKSDKGWGHYFDADTKEDAEADKYSLKNNGERVKIIRVHKDKADWRNPEHRKAALELLGE